MGELEDTALHEAVRYGDLEGVKSALEAGCEPNQVGLYEWTALHEAAHNGDLQIIKLLLQNKGDANRRDLLKGCTALHYAASQAHAQCLVALLDAGGYTDIKNNNGETCLDVATGECVAILNNKRMEETLQGPPPTIDPAITTHEDTQSAEGMTAHDQSCSDVKSLLAESESLPSTCCSEESMCASDVQSIRSDCSDIPIKRPWVTGTVINLPPNHLVLGNIQLSFEYNSKRAYFKVRIWQVTDLIMPPVETSMINGLYVKSILVPDKRRSSKRKTELINVYKSPSAESKLSNSLLSWTFKFKKALEYDKITVEMLNNRTVHIELCVTQKYTSRSFCIASWSMPMSMAMRRLVKEIYPLTPHIGVGMPENMKVYSANHLSISRSNRPYWSNPNTRVASTISLSHTQNPRAVSDSDLQRVLIASDNLPSIEITVPSEEDDLTADLEQISVTESKQEMAPEEIAIAVSKQEMAPELCSHARDSSSLEEESMSPVDFAIVTMQPAHHHCQEIAIEMNEVSSLQEQPGVHGQMPSKSEKARRSSLHKWKRKISLKEKKSDISDESGILINKERRWSLTKKNHKQNDMEVKYIQQVISNDAENNNSRKSNEVQSKEKRWSLSRKESQPDLTGKNKIPGLAYEHIDTGFSSRPESPTWDNFQNLPSFAMVPMDFEFDVFSNVSDTRKIRQTETGLDIPSIHKSIRGEVGLEKRTDQPEHISVKAKGKPDRHTSHENQPPATVQLELITTKQHIRSSSCSPVFDVEMGVEDIEEDIFEV